VLELPALAHHVVEELRLPLARVRTRRQHGVPLRLGAARAATCRSTAAAAAAEASASENSLETLLVAVVDAAGWQGAARAHDARDRVCCTLSYARSCGSECAARASARTSARAPSTRIFAGRTRRLGTAKSTC
jgi:hypothetical protein